MRITVKLYATLRQYGPELLSGEGFALEVPASSDVAWVVERLGIPDGVPLLAMVNGELVHLGHMVAEGDTVSLFPPVAGGM